MGGTRTRLHPSIRLGSVVGWAFFTSTSHLTSGAWYQLKLTICFINVVFIRYVSVKGQTFRIKGFVDLCLE